MGINSIMESFQQAYPKPQSYMKALRLKSMGFNDLIDLLLYTTTIVMEEFLRKYQNS